MKLLSSKKSMLALALVGVAALVVAIKSKEEPIHSELVARPYLVETLDLEVMSVTPEITGYGLVEPTISVEKLAEVSGNIEFVHFGLEAGIVLDKDTIVVRIDDTDHRLAFQQAQSNVIAANANLEELLNSELSLKKHFQLIERKLILSKKEFKRKESLRNKNAISQSTLDGEQVKVLQLEQERESFAQQIAVIPNERQALEAQLVSSQAMMAQAKRDIERAVIRMPYTGRVSSSSVEEGQFATIGKPLFTIQGIEQVDVNAQFTLEQFAPFLELFSQSNSDIQNIDSRTIKSFINTAGLAATVSLPIAPNQTWEGEVVAVRSQLDPQSRTIGVIVRIDKPYDGIIPGKRPPLIEGLHVEVTLEGTALEAVQIPIYAIHADELYFYQDDKLVIKTATPILHMEKYSIYASSLLEAGKQLVVTDVIPAIDGMPITNDADTKGEESK